MASNPHDDDPQSPLAARPQGELSPWSPLASLVGTVKATRRSVIASLLAAVGTAAGRTAGLAAPPAAPVGTLSPNALGTINQVPGQNFRIRVVRPNDFLYYEVEFVNIVPVGNPPTTMRRAAPSRAGYLVVHHQAQSIVEQAYQDFPASEAGVMPSRDAPATFPATPAEQAALAKIDAQKPGPGGAKIPGEPTPGPAEVAQTRIAGESRVVFTMPNIASFPFTLAALLDAFGTWEMSLDPSARPPPNDFLIPPDLLLKFAQAGSNAASILSVDDLKRLYSHLPLDQQKKAFPAIIGVPPSPGGGEPTATQHLRTLLSQHPSQLIQPFFSKTLPPAAATTGGTLPVIAGAALPPPGPPHEPAATVTALELPYRVIQSPLPNSGWRHESTDDRAQHNQRYELWHTRLGARASDGSVDDTAEMPVRAIWSPDYPVPQPDTPFTQPLDGVDRQMLVKLMSGYNEYAGGNVYNTQGRVPYTPKPASAKRLMLSALGGWLVEDGDWDQRPVGVDLTEWNHRAAMARDYYVRVVYAGFLYPFGHAASLVKVTERKFEDSQRGPGRIAVLRQRFFIVVRQKTRLYQHPNQAFKGRDLPFARIDCLIQTTPDIAEPKAAVAGALDREVFWPMVAGGATLTSSTDFKFQMLGFDHFGRTIPFATPAMFVSEIWNTPDQLQALHPVYNNEDVSPGLPHRRAPQLNGAMVKVVPDDDATGDGDTNLPLEAVAFIGATAVGTVPSSSSEPNPAQFFPGTNSLSVRLPAVQRILGTNDPVTAKISDIFTGKLGDVTPPGFDRSLNPGQVFLEIEKAVNALPDGTPNDKGGGLVTPSLLPQALSRQYGTVAAKVHDLVNGDPAKDYLTNFAQGAFKPEELVPDIKLLGVLPISKIFQALSDLGDAPKLLNEELPDRIRATLNIHQETLQAFPDPSLTPDPIFQPNAPADDGGNQKSVLDITSTIEVMRPAVGVSGGTPQVTPQQPTATVVGSLTFFKINLFGCLVISFDSIGFSAQPGQKPDVTIGINKDHGIRFKGPLEFVNELKNYIPSNGFTDPPNLSVTPAGISASYSLALPSVTVGVMSLQNVTIGAGFDLPFDGKPPTAKFNFAEKQNPFNLTVSLLGGGGFLAIEVNTHGVQMVEAQLEFGAFASIDLGVASGSVYVKGGFHFYWSGSQDGTDPTASGKVELDAFVELGGHLSVLGLISVSLVFHVDLSYEEIDSPKSSQLIGQATLTVDVEVLFFSKSVSVSVEKQFAGSARDPKFVDFIPDETVWQDYCEAFAA